MKRYKILKLINIFLLFLLITVNAQNSQYENKMQQYFSSKEKSKALDKDYLTNLIDFSDSICNIKPLDALKYLYKAKDIAFKFNDQYELARIHEKIGSIYFNQKIYYLSMENYLTSSKLYKQLNNKSRLAYTLLNIGNNYYAQDVFDIPMTYYREAEKNFKSDNNYFGQSICFNNMGLVYTKSNNYDSALICFKEALKLRELLNNPFYIAHDLLYIGNIYSQKNEINKAKFYILKSIDLLKKLSDNEAIRYKGKAYADLSSIYEKELDYNNTIFNLKEALEVYKGLKSNYFVIITTDKIASIYLLMNKDDEAKYYLNSASAIILSNNINQLKSDHYFLWIKYYVTVGNKAKVLEYLNKYKEAVDLYSNEKMANKLAEVHTAIETYEQEREINNLLEKNKEEKLSFFLLLIIASLLIIFISILFIINKKNQIRFKQLSNSAIEGIVIYNQGKIIDCNKNFEKITGYLLKELKKINIYKLIGKIKNINENNTFEEEISYQIDYKSRDGKYSFLEITARPILYRNKYIRVASVRDITAQKIDADNLRQSEEKYKFIAENVSDVIWQVDNELRIIYISPSCIHLYGFKDDELIGKSFYKLISPDMVNNFENFIKNNHKNNVCEIKQICKSGNTFWVEIQYNLINDSSGNFVCYQGVSRNINDRKIMDIQLKKEKEKAEEANNIKSQFLANISHEIRTPLNSILGFSNLLKDYVNHEKAFEYIDSIELGSRNLLNIINDILDLSKIEAAKMSLELLQFNFKTLLNNLYNLFDLQIEEKNLSFSLSFQEGMPSIIYLDELRLNQILTNLLSNAIKFTEKGFININVYYNILNYNYLNLQIQVEDSGIGISKDRLEKIFEAFYQQTGTTNVYGGTGLGLTISKKLCEMMNGTLSVHSALGKGSKFIASFYNVKYVNKIETNGSNNITAIENPSSEFSFDDISEYQYSILKDEYLPQLLSANRMMIIDEVQETAIRLKYFAKNNNIKSLIEFSDNLYKCSESYDTEKIKYAILSFTKIFSESNKN